MNTHHDTATPTLSVIDPRALAVRSVAYCRHPDKADIESRITRQIFDEAGRQVASCDPRLFGVAPKPNLATLYALSGQELLTDSVDAGWQVRLLNEAGSMCSGWDARGSQSHRQYDDLQRPLALTEQAHDGQPRVVERWIYGKATDDRALHNQCGRPIRHDDPAGNRHFDDYGLGGTVVVESRRFLIELETPDWPLDPDRRDDYLEETTYVTRQTFTPTGDLQHHTDAVGNLRTQHYNVAGQSCATWLLQAGEGRQPKCLVSAIRYNAQGQIESETAGNGVIACAEYSREDARLLRLFASVGVHPPLQDLNYVYDPMGNVMSLEDKTQAVSWFNNQRIDSVSRYRYDSLYQLVEASGWEVSQPSHGPALPDLLPTPLDPNQRRNYTQKFDYDAAGNLITRHHSGAPGFSMFTSAYSNRSLAQHADGSLPGESEIALGFDAAGNQLELQRGQAMYWNVRNELSRVVLLKRPNESDDYECYCYDEPGHRLRKTTVSQASGQTLTVEVRYLPGLEIHREVDGVERHVVNIDTGRNQVRLLHWPSAVDGDQLRYSLSDHLGSSTLELDDGAGILTQEHYYPFGGTACWAGRNALVAKSKTTRYSGKERDATGLYYYGYRYYAPWLQRWVSVDPRGEIDGLNVFLFVRANPVSRIDPNGLDSETLASVFMSRSNRASDRADDSRDAFRMEVDPKAKFRSFVQTIINRNRELKNLGAFVVYASVDVPFGKSFFWSGDKVDQSGNVEKSAMLTAQFLAAQDGGSTIEMTSGGQMLDNYSSSKWPVSAASRSSPGFMFLKSRFKYMDSPLLREELIKKLPQSLGSDVEAILGATFFTGPENPLNSPNSGVAGVLWDVVSIRFARQATGEVNVIHAGSSTDPYFQGAGFMRSTWMTKERVSLAEEAKTTIVERFGEDLEDWQLQAPR